MELPRFLLESPRFLLARGDAAGAVEVLREVAATNRAPLPADAQLGNVTQTDGSAGAQENVVRFAVRADGLEVDVELQLRCCPAQPRPAWFAVDGARLDRRIGPDYEISFESVDGRVANVQDPLAALVYGLLDDLQRAPRERTDAIADAIALRLRLYAGVLERLRGTAG